MQQPSPSANEDEKKGSQFQVKKVSVSGRLMQENPSLQNLRGDQRGAYRMSARSQSPQKRFYAIQEEGPDKLDQSQSQMS